MTGNAYDDEAVHRAMLAEAEQDVQSMNDASTSELRGRLASALGLSAECDWAELLTAVGHQVANREHQQVEVERARRAHERVEGDLRTARNDIFRDRERYRHLIRGMARRATKLRRERCCAEHANHDNLVYLRRAVDLPENAPVSQIKAKLIDTQRSVERLAYLEAQHRRGDDAVHSEDGAWQARAVEAAHAFVRIGYVCGLSGEVSAADAEQAVVKLARERDHLRKRGEEIEARDPVGAINRLLEEAGAPSGDPVAGVLWLDEDRRETKSELLRNIVEINQVLARHDIEVIPDGAAKTLDDFLTEHEMHPGTEPNRPQTCEARSPFRIGNTRLTCEAEPDHQRMYNAWCGDAFVSWNSEDARTEFSVGDPEPGSEVRAVEDRDGDIWHRGTAKASGWYCMLLNDSRWWEPLLGLYGPLTDVTGQYDDGGYDREDL
jgi:hypothetical protein